MSTEQHSLFAVQAALHSSTLLAALVGRAGGEGGAICADKVARGGPRREPRREIHSHKAGRSLGASQRRGSPSADSRNTRAGPFLGDLVALGPHNLFFREGTALECTADDAVIVDLS